jgi:hypothetical protein
VQQGSGEKPKGSNGVVNGSGGNSVRRLITGRQRMNYISPVVSDSEGVTPAEGVAPGSSVTEGMVGLAGGRAV